MISIEDNVPSRIPQANTLIVPKDTYPPEEIVATAQNKDIEKQTVYENNFICSDGHEDVNSEQPYGWVVVAAAFFVQVMVIGTVNGYGVYQDRYITHEYNTASTFELSWIGTLNVVGMNLLGPFTGQFADHFGYRISALLGAVIMGASLIATSFATEIWQLYICQGILYGFGASLAFFPSLSLPSQWFKERRGLATGIAVAGGGFGGLVISPATTSMFSSIGYRWTVRTVAFIHLAVLIPAALLFKARTTLTVPRKQAIVDFSVLKEKRFLILVALCFFVANGYFNPYYYFPTYVQKRGSSVSTASLLVGILNGSSAVGRVLMGLTSDYIGDINTLFISSLIASLSVLVVWMLAGTSIPVMVIFCVIFGFFSGSYVAIVPTVAAHLCISRLASVTGIVYGGIAIGTLIGAPVGGALLDLSQGDDYRPLQIWAGIVMAVGATLSLVLKLTVNSKLFGRV
ncbi:major facilitator superfamily domain-containing protein [Lobosporangium transversale]|uniref:Major facilitator superfamily domain-containing protein n=1 Tax=Lobosporangium transversale TaxID=64571 RepID=A0A1Y2GXA2_9FUNG|nr:major facilitator superfamily domain-containing protein [Lobosporangium transversale]ORZ26895.1 major facilitator superfamily domain-containing protein [Lobosporangium transversale]|eukprot:XP_021884642.1 major facilitator superfamily domain-containing protein [Lobosporangium transversale]